MTDTTRPSEDTAPRAWATTRTMPYAVGPAPEPGSPPEAAPPASSGPPSTAPPSTAPPSTAPPSTAPALNPPTWSGRKTAVAAALAIGFSTVGAVGAAAALPSGTTDGVPSQFQRGGFGPGQLPGGQLPGGQGPGGQVPGGQGQFPQQGPLGQPGQQSVPGQQGAPGQPQPADPNASTT